MDDRQAFAAIIYVLRTGIQWNALPRELGASSTVHDRFEEWEQKGLFKTLWQAGLMEYDEVQGIEWEWQSVDGAMTKAPFGCAPTGANPTDPSKLGVKRSLLTDGAGIPLAVIIDGANRHDMKLLGATLDGIVIARPDPAESQPQHLCLDAGYDYPVILQEVEDHQYTPHIHSRGTEKQEKVFTPGYRARRWVVERTHSWINRSRRLLVRWEKKRENYLAFLHLACAQLIFAKILVFG
jgi:putative transposase